MNLYFNKNNRQIFYRNKPSLVSNSRPFVSLVQVSQSFDLLNKTADNGNFETVSNLNLRQLSGLQFCRFFWLARYLSNLNFGSQILLVISEPFLDEEELKYSLYSGILLSKSLSTNSLSLVLKQSLSGSAVERTFFLNATNFILIKKF